jgi:site-specific recombinase XerD
MKYIVNGEVVLPRTLAGPIAPHLRAFAASQSAQGYAPYSLYRRVLIAADFSRWLGLRGVALRRIGFDHQSRYLRYRARHVKPRSDDACSLRRLVEFLRREGLVRAEKRTALPLTPVERCTRAYEQYLYESCASARATVVNYGAFVRDFLNHCFGIGPVRLGQLRAMDVVKFVQHRATRLSLKRAKLMTSALRSFLRYARFHGALKLDLSAAVPTVANWSMSAIPRAIGPDQVRQLLASIDRRSAMGRRDYAVLLLLARLGLRAGEVSSLTLDDIDWQAGQLCVQGKGGQRSVLPLPADVGKAIAGYLHQGRPHSSDRCVFVRARAPARGFVGVAGISSIVRHALERAGIDAPTKGAHQFRHGLATEMLRKGASLSQIGELLGHRHPDTTRIYAKVDIKALRQLALPWPGAMP